MRDLPMPWFPRALQALDLRPRDRVLLALPGTALAVATVAQCIGKDGRLVVLEPDRRQAEAIAHRVAAAEVVAGAEFDQRFGAFDAVLALPNLGPLPSAAAFGALLQRNLRPGGRFAVDLPGPDAWPALTAAALTVSPEFARRLSAAGAGPEANDLLDAVRAAGMRRVEPLLGAHLVSLESPLALLDLAAHRADLTDDERLALGDALVRTLGTTGACEALAHRSAAAGSR